MRLLPNDPILKDIVEHIRRLEPKHSLTISKAILPEDVWINGDRWSAVDLMMESIPEASYRFSIIDFDQEHQITIHRHDFDVFEMSRRRFKTWLSPTELRCHGQWWEFKPIGPGQGYHSKLIQYPVTTTFMEWSRKVGSGQISLPRCEYGRGGCSIIPKIERCPNAGNWISPNGQWHWCDAHKQNGDRKIINSPEKPDSSKA